MASERQRWMPIVGVGYYFFLPTADARHSGFNRAHFKTQHSCLLCIWAPIERGGRREERSRREQVKQKKKKKTGNENERESRRRAV